MPQTTVSTTAVRRLAVAAQGYAGRYRRGTTADVERSIRRLSCVQLDSISTVDRSHRIALGSRVGGFPADAVSTLLSRGRIFEYCQGFQRVYDLAERVIPRAQLAAPAPSEDERLRTLAELAVRARGALTETGIKEHWRLQGGVARIRPAVDDLVAAGRLRRLRVDDGGADVLVPHDAELDLPAPSAAVLLSPFDNLLWGRPFARRILGFDHLIEVYKPAPQRRFGYYVLPFLRGDRIVGRADLKSERKEGRLLVRAFHLEPGVRRSGALDDAFDRALARLARTIGLVQVVR